MRRSGIRRRVSTNPLIKGVRRSPLRNPESQVGLIAPLARLKVPTQEPRFRRRGAGSEGPHQPNLGRTLKKGVARDPLSEGRRKSPLFEGLRSWLWNIATIGFLRYPFGQDLSLRRDL